MIGKAIRYVLEMLRGERRDCPHRFDIPAVCEPTLNFALPINGVWGSAAEHGVTPSRLFDHYLEPATSTDEVLAGAILVYGNGSAWNTTEHSEGFLHLESWLLATTALLEGASSHDIWAWEESGMQAVRQDNLIILEERTHHASYQLAPVCFELQRFGRELVEATRTVVDLLSSLKQLSQERYPVEWRNALEVHQGLRARGEQSPAVPPMDLQAALALLEAIEPGTLKDQLPADFQLPQMTSTDVRADRLQTVLDYLAGERLSTSWARLAAKVGCAG